MWVYWNGGGGPVGTNAIQVGTGGQYTDGQWHHIALTRSGSTLTLYIDGVAVGTANYSDPIDLSGGNNNYLGKYAGNNFFWNGQIDEVEVFNRAITGAEVLKIYNSSCTGKCPCTPAPDGMVSWWRAEGDAVDTKDGNDGTFNGTPAYSSGEVGRAFSFNNDASSYVFVPHNTNLDLAAFTVDAWVYPTGDSTNGYGSVVDKEASTGGSTTLYLLVTTVLSRLISIPAPTSSLIHLRAPLRGTHGRIS